MELRAIREIKVGEKITISYCDPKQKFATREKELRRRYNIQCTCPHCNLSRICEESDERRMGLRELSEALQEGFSNEEDLEMMSKILESGLKMAERENLQTYNYLFIRSLVLVYALQGDINNTRHWGEIAMQLSIAENIGVEAYKIRGVWGMFLMDLTVHPLWCFKKKNVRKIQALLSH